MVRNAYPARAVEAKQAAVLQALNEIDLPRRAPGAGPSCQSATRRGGPGHDAAMTGVASVVADYTDQLALLDKLGIAERSEADRILTSNLDPGALQAVQQLEIVVTAAAAAGNETPAYLGTVFNPSHSHAAGQAWLQAWTTYEGASADMGTQLAAPWLPSGTASNSSPKRSSTTPSSTPRRRTGRARR